MELVDFIFDLLDDGLIKIRIFFRHNQYVPKYLTREHMRKEYSMLYYQFIKHAFGFQYSNDSDRPVFLHIALDELPISEPEKKEFKDFIFRLGDEMSFKAANIKIRKDELGYLMNIYRIIIISLNSMSFIWIIIEKRNSTFQLTSLTCISENPLRIKNMILLF